MGVSIYVVYRASKLQGACHWWNILVFLVWSVSFYGFWDVLAYFFCNWTFYCTYHRCRWWFYHHAILARVFSGLPPKIRMWHNAHINIFVSSHYSYRIDWFLDILQAVWYWFSPFHCSIYHFWCGCYGSNWPLLLIFISQSLWISRVRTGYPSKVPIWVKSVLFVLSQIYWYSIILN